MEALLIISIVGIFFIGYKLEGIYELLIKWKVEWDSKNSEDDDDFVPEG